ncbi:helix-turn-helix transcriptional regulator [Clostridium sp. HBUAS56010]|uniref:helix-turn-helix transcriptional regulator n=1 Tax=Clostridium sp. HBUAS56010 TaxID=2571127 RepID=UPI0011789042|nr:helix-turn-helix transcriptional regulator [Clostridium sp. HBUAS56010]
MIGKRIKVLREEKHLSQEKLAAELGVSRMTVNNYENEKRAPDIDFARHLADYFGVTVEFLMGGTGYRYKRDEIISLKKSETLFRIMEKLPQPEIQEVVSSLIEALEKSVELDMAEEVVHVMNHCCVQVRGLLYGYEDLKDDIAAPVKKLKKLSVPIDSIREAVHDKPRVVYDAAFHATERISEEVNHCAESMERKLEKLVDATLKEPVNETS